MEVFKNLKYITLFITFYTIAMGSHFTTHSARRFVESEFVRTPKLNIEGLKKMETE
jgi:hypothetical protein